jgi:hypothetical protein
VGFGFVREPGGNSAAIAFSQGSFFSLNLGKSANAHNRVAVALVFL